MPSTLIRSKNALIRKNINKKDNLSDPPKAKKVAIVGLPNTGKSQVFNNLTGEYTLVANYPLTTVEMKTSHCQINDLPYEIIDTPGLHGLYIHSQEELVVRDMLFSERPDILVQCVDANQLKQSLALTIDLLELGIPMIIALNALDETAKKGVWINAAELSRHLGVPVVESVAVSGMGTDELKTALPKARPGRWPVAYGKEIDKRIPAIAATLPKEVEFRRKAAALLLLDDPFLAKSMVQKYGKEKTTQLIEQLQQTKKQFKGNIGLAVNSKRSRWVEDLVESATRRQRIKPGKISQGLGRLSRHPVFGVPILLVVVMLMYFLVVNVANVLAGWMDETLWVPVANRIDSVVTIGWLNEFLIGDYGVLSLGLANAFLTIMPILTVFFLAFNVLEDAGYIPNLCVLTKRVFDKLGLSGSAVMPLVLGFGCKTMATLTTKSLRSQKERYIAIYLIAFSIPCAAQMALNMSILGRMGFMAFAITFSVLAFVEIVAGLVLNKIMKEEERSDFLQELPPMRLPNLRAVLRKTVHRLVHFIKEAVPVFIYAAIILFALDKSGILDGAKHVLRPVMNNVLGLPVQMVDALILCMARHEAAAGLIMKLIKADQLNYVQCIVAVTITTMFVPCFANIMAMVKELGAKRAILMAIMINASSFVVAGLLYWALVLLRV